MASDNRKSYSEKLRDPRWQRKRLEIMERDSFRCRKCSRGDVTLNVHHLRYDRGAEPWEYCASNLETLCENCHASEHGKSVTERSDDIANAQNTPIYKPSGIGRLPPLQVELIGLLFFDVEVGEFDIAQLTSDDFTNETCRTAFEVIADVIHSGVERSVDEVFRVAESRGVFKEIEEAAQREITRKPHLTMTPRQRFDDAMKQIRRWRSERDQRAVIAVLEQRRERIDEEAGLLANLFEQERNRRGIRSGATEG